MRRHALFAAALSLGALLGTVTIPARAADDCPDGDWFCEPAPAAEPAPTAPGPPPAGAGTEREGRRRERPTSPQGSPFEAPPPPSRYDDRRMNIDVENVQPARPRHRRRFREWGVNLHVNVGIMGNDDDMSPDASMNGFGGALRFRP